jgi:serine/threonine protein phosphatase PrpC/LysM repeat protein
VADQLKIQGGGKSNAGLNKEFNTQTWLEFPLLNGQAFLVADGFDGDQGHGALASKMVAESIKKYFHNRTYKEMGSAITNAITYANYTLFDQIQKDGKYKGIGSAFALLVVYKNKAWYAYSGNCKLYKVQDKEIVPLTSDHVKDGKVFNLLGSQKDARFGVSKNPIELQNSDIFFLTTKDYPEVLDIDTIGEVIRDGNMLPDHKMIKLEELANAINSTKDYSGVIIELAGRSANKAVRKEKGNIPWGKAAIYALAITVLALVGKWAWVNDFWMSPDKKEKVENIPENKGESKIKKIVEPVNEDKVDGKDTEGIEAGNENNKPQEAEVKNKVGQEKSIIKPKAEATGTPKEKVPGTDFIEHKVVYGENLYRLGLRYHVAQDKLIEINAEKAKKLVAGSYLKIPVTQVHVIQTGETLQHIAQKYGVKAKYILAANKLEKDAVLKAGEELIVPLK